MENACHHANHSDKMAIKLYWFLQATNVIYPSFYANPKFGNTFVISRDVMIMRIWTSQKWHDTEILCLQTLLFPE